MNEWSGERGPTFFLRGGKGFLSRSRTLFLLYALCGFGGFGALGGCSLMPDAKAIRACRYQFHALEFDHVDSVNTYWKLYLEVQNPNSRKVDFSRMDAALLYQGDTVLQGRNPSRQTLKANSKDTLQTLVAVPFTSIKKHWALLTQSQVEFDLRGDVIVESWMGKITYPDAIHQRVKIDMAKHMGKLQGKAMGLLMKLMGWGP